MSKNRPGTDTRLLIALVFSGTAALGYELIWTRLLGLVLGHEFLGILAALGGFFGGLALGSALLHERARKSRDPAKLFALLEGIAASYALLSPWILTWLAAWVPEQLGSSIGTEPQNLFLPLLVAVVALLPATICMGGTFPAVVEARRRAILNQHDGRGVGRLYAANTLGAVIGCALTVHLVLPAVGLSVGAAILSACGAAAAALAISWSRGSVASKAPSADEDVDDASTGSAMHPPVLDTSKDADAGVAEERWLLLVLVFGTGLVGVGVEVVGVRVLSQVTSNTVYTFADVLAVYLLGTALGAWLYQRYVHLAVGGAPARVLAGLLLAQALCVVVAAAVLRQAPSLLESLAGAGAQFGARMAAEVVVSVCVFALPTVLMGATFSHLIGLLAGRGVGRAYALNTLGSALAPFALGLWAIPSLGLTDSFFALSWAYLLLLVGFAWFRRFSTAWQLASMAAVLSATVLGKGSLILVETSEDWSVIERHEGVMGVVTVSEQKVEGRPALKRLQVDQQFRMGGARSIGERRMGHIPLLLHGDAKDVLYLGVGTGATAGASLAHQVTSVDAVELVPEVLSTLHHFHDINGTIDEDARMSLHVADARRWLAGAGDQSWDVIVADLFHPARDGAGFLYAREHFESVHSHLREGGLFAQWLPLHQLEPETLRVIVATFLEVFPNSHSWLALYNVESPAFALIGVAGDAPLVVDVDALATTVKDPAFAPVVLQDPRDLFAAYMLDAQGLASLAGDAPLNTDLRPRVLFDAPKSDGQGLGRANLEVLLPLRTGVPEGLATSKIDGFEAQAAAFSEALEFYLRAEMVLIDEAVPGEPLPAAAVEDYVSAIETAPEFVPPRGRLRAHLGLLQKSGRGEEATELMGRLQNVSQFSTN